MYEPLCSGWDEHMTPKDGRRPVWSQVGRAVLLLVAALGAATVASLAFTIFGYMVGEDDFGDDVDWSTQPLEVVAVGTEACVLNVDAVAPGRHDVAAFAEGARAQVVIKDPSGEVIFRTVAETAEEPVRQPFVRLRELGAYRVECRSGGAVSSATLQVTTADELAGQ